MYDRQPRQNPLCLPPPAMKQRRRLRGESPKETRNPRHAGLGRTVTESPYPSIYGVVTFTSGNFRIYPKPAVTDLARARERDHAGRPIRTQSTPKSVFARSIIDFRKFRQFRSIATNPQGTTFSSCPNTVWLSSLLTTIILSRPREGPSLHVALLSGWSQGRGCPRV